MKAKLIAGVAPMALAVFIPDAAMAQGKPVGRQNDARQGPIASGTLDEIVVTAQKRSESARRIPIVINAVTGDGLKKSGVSGLGNQQQVAPNLTFLEGGGNHASIRGVGSTINGPGAEDPVAIHFDGIYIGNNAGNFLPFVSAARTGVIAGPQGTLFGRNTTGGCSTRRSGSSR